MENESKPKATTSGTRLPFRWRPAHEVLAPPKLLPVRGPALGRWTRPVDDLAQRSVEVGQGLRRRMARLLRESITCAMAIVCVTCIGCASALGWGRPRRILTAAVVFSVPWFYLGLPAGWESVLGLSELIAAGHWAASAKLTAGLLGGGLLVFHFVMAFVRVPLAREQLPMLCLEDRLAQTDTLTRVPVTNDSELSDWVARVRAWSVAVETELRELHSPEAAYAFRRVAPGDTVRHAHRFNSVHDGWLNMLAWRRNVLADLADPRARRGFRRPPSELRVQVA
jgi:hypothetical protein